MTSSVNITEESRPKQGLKTWIDGGVAKGISRIIQTMMGKHILDLGTR